MTQHNATIVWTRSGAAFTDHRYSRGHVWRFDEGVEVPASASPHVVRLPMSVAAAVDPEEAFVAALSSCHMLWFLDFASRRGFVVDSYEDAAIGTMGRSLTGKECVATVTLRPRALFGGAAVPTRADIMAMHHAAHDACYIANSVTTDVRCEPPEE